MATLQRYFIQISYKGTNFHGWQSQENAITIQKILTEVMSLKLQEDIELMGAGRTDTGVHASYYIAHFDTTLQNLDKDEKKKGAINNFLPVDIAVQKIIKVDNNAHARFDAISRTYKYYISLEKNPFISEESVLIKEKLNVENMNLASKALLEYTDFESFCKLHSDNKTSICKIVEAKWYKKNNTLIFEITADRFLRNMVRAIVGTMLDVGREKITIEQFKNIIEKKDRSAAGTSAKAKGLFLTNIEYSFIQ